VLVHSAAGSVGSALVQLAKWRNAKVIALVGQEYKEKIAYSLGADWVINRKEESYQEAAKRYLGDQTLDVSFNSMGGKTIKYDLELLGPGGRVIGFGASPRSGKGAGTLKDIKTVLGAGFYNPMLAIMQAKGFVGVNMLQIARNKPRTILRCLRAVKELYEQGHINPLVGEHFLANDIAKAHEYVQSGQSVGKIWVSWD
jgi:NADPH2:quinone reductase